AGAVPASARGLSGNRRATGRGAVARVLRSPPLEPAPDLHGLRIAGPEAARVAAGRRERPVVAVPHFLEPAAFVDDQPNVLGLPPRIGLGELAPDAARVEIVAARQAVEVGPAQAVPQQADRAEIALGCRGHAGPVLGPLVCEQGGRRGHAQVARELPAGRRPRGAPLRPGGAASLGPQPVNDETEASFAARALPPVGDARLTAAAVLGRPAEREGVTGYRHAPHGPVARRGGHFDRQRYAALVGLRVRGAGDAGQGRGEGGRGAHGQSKVAAPAGRSPLNHAAASARNRNTTAATCSAQIASPRYCIAPNGPASDGTAMITPIAMKTTRIHFATFEAL